MTDPTRLLSTILLATSFCFADSGNNHLVAVHSFLVSVSFPRIKDRVVPFPLVKSRTITGSGICLDKRCSIVATANHVRLLAGRKTLNVAGARTEKVLSPATENDPHNSDTAVLHSKRRLSFNIAKDISFIYTKKPIHRKSGIPVSYKPFVGEAVHVAGYTGHTFWTKEAHIIGSNVRLISGEAELTENLILDVPLEAGNSGGAVLDKRGNLLGMVILTGELKLDNANIKASVALPVRSIATFLVQVDPVLGINIFGNIPEPELKPEQIQYVYQEIDVPEEHSPIMPDLAAHHSEVPNAVAMLHVSALNAFKQARNLIATQCLVQGTQEPVCYEVGLVAGKQVFRRVENNGTIGTPKNHPATPKHGVWALEDWADDLEEIADEAWVFEGSIGDRYLFTNIATADDERCYFEESPRMGVPLFGGWHPKWQGPVDCFLAVVTDNHFNVVLSFMESRPPDNCLTKLFQRAMYYDYLKLEESPMLLPVRERIVAKLLQQEQPLYSSVTWTDYRKFRSEHRITYREYRGLSSRE
jgi:Trypsin-like peptidase domain